MSPFRRSPPKMPQKIVLERKEELRGSRIALAPGAAAQLVVYAARFMPFGAEHMQVRRVPAPSRASAVGGLPPRKMSTPRPAMLVATVTAPGLPGLRDDRAFALVVLRVQNLMLDAGGAKAPRRKSRSSRSRSFPKAPAGLSSAVPSRRGPPHPLSLRNSCRYVVQVLAPQRLVRRDAHDFQDGKPYGIPRRRSARCPSCRRSFCTCGNNFGRKFSHTFAIPL